MLKRRRASFRAQTDLDPRRLVFVDETGASTKMARLHGRAPCGDKAAHGGAARPLEDDHLRRRVPVVGDDRAARAGRADDGRMVRRLGRPCARPHAPSPPRSHAPTLRRGDIVILDNLPAHKSAAARAAVEARG